MASSTNGPLIVKPVRSRGDRHRFLNLPWQLYADDPNWIPPIRSEQRAYVAFSSHPFYDDAEIQTFLAERDGRPCGRVAAIVNHAHNRRFEDRTGFFGFFESVDDQEVASALLNAAWDWVAQREMDCLRGPCNPSMNYECGLLVEGFDTPPTFMMTYNPPYYADLLQSHGFAKSQDLYAYWGQVDMLDQMDGIAKLKSLFRAFKERFNLRFRQLRTRHFREEVRIYLNTYNEAMAGHWGFTPFSPAEIRHLSSGLRHLIVPELTCIAETDGRPVGMSLGLPDYNPIIKQIDGRLFPFGFIRLYMNRRRLSRVRLMTSMVLPEFQRWGLGFVLLGELLPRGLAMGVKEVEISWIAESNLLSLNTVKRGGAKRVKTYRLYDYKPSTAESVNPPE